MKNKGMILKTCTYLLIMVLGTMSLLAACAEPAPAPPTPAPPAPTPPAPTPPAPTPPTPGPPAPAKKLIVAIDMEPQTMDPTSQRFAPFNMTTNDNIYDSFMAYTADGKPDPSAGIASWEILEGGKVFEYTLRQGVKFHSGDPLTTKDIVFTHERSTEFNPQYQRDMRNLDHLEVVDDYTIRFVFKEPDVLWKFQFGFHPCSKSYFDRVGENEYVSKPSGTGPYKFVEWKPGQYIDLEANEDYWGEKPTVKQVRIVFVRESMTRVAMLQAGEADIIMNTPWEMVGEIENAGFRTVRVPACSSISVQFHTKNPNVPWYDKRVRQAIAHAIDREAVVETLFHGIPNAYSWQGPNDLGYDPECQLPPYDPAKAKELLAEAGYPDGFEMPVYYSMVTGAKETVESVTLYLKAIDITCDVTSIEGPQWMEMMRKWSADPTAEAVFISNPCMANYTDPARYMFMQFYSQNPMGMYANPEVDALIDKIMTTMDDTERGELVKQAYWIMNDDIPVIQIESNVRVYSMKPNIEMTRPSKVSSGMFLEYVRIKD